MKNKWSDLTISHTYFIYENRKFIMCLMCFYISSGKVENNKKSDISIQLAWFNYNLLW